MEALKYLETRVGIFKLTWYKIIEMSKKFSSLSETLVKVNITEKL